MRRGVWSIVIGNGDDESIIVGRDEREKCQCAMIDRCGFANNSTDTLPVMQCFTVHS